MCKKCFQEYGEPKIEADEVEEAAQAIEEVFDHALAGGNLHIVISDWNLDDGSLEFCDSSISENATDGSEEQVEAERTCHTLLSQLTERERASAMGFCRGFWD